MSDKSSAEIRVTKDSAHGSGDIAGSDKDELLAQH